MAASIYDNLTAAELLASMSKEFGGDGADAADRTALLEHAIVDAAKEIWEWAPWKFKLVRYTLTTVASQSYIELPSDYDSYQAPQWLNYPDHQSYKIINVPDISWDSAIQQFTPTAEGKPEMWTIINRALTGVQTAVVEFAPIPDAIYSITGLQYFSKTPSLDFTTSDVVFPSEFDVLWHTASRRNAARMLPDLVDINERVVTQTEYEKMMDTAAQKYGVREVQMIGQGVLDTYGDAGDLASSLRYWDDSGFGPWDMRRTY